MLNMCNGQFVLSFMVLLGMGIPAGWAAPSLPPIPARATNTLIWNTAQNRVSAEITGWGVEKLLQEIARLTAWQIYIEPETTHTVSTKFKDRAPGEALGMLLGNLSFALLPQSNAPAKLFVFRTTLQEATQLIKPAIPKIDATAKPIPNELVVMLKPGAKIDELAEKLGAKVKGRIDSANAYRLSFEDADAAQAGRDLLKDNPDVASVSNNYWMSRPDPALALSLSSSFPFELKPRQGDGPGPIIGLIDTTIQRTGGPLDAFLLDSVSVADTTAKPPADQPTHGTSMWETILRGLSLKGNETAAKILAIDVYGDNPSSTTFEVAHGIAEAVNRGATIINLSLSSAGDSPLLRETIQRSSDLGVLFVAAAGNDATTAPTYPAAYPEVVAVTAGTRDGSIASYANHGDFIDIVAPGVTIVPFNGQQWIVTGTSPSTALTTGLIGTVPDANKMPKQDLLNAITQFFKH